MRGFCFLTNLNGFPTDNLPSTQLKYDIVASKFMTGIENHHKRNAPVSLGHDLGLFGAVIKGLVALVNTYRLYMLGLKKRQTHYPKSNLTC